jgi:adenylate cyclase
MSNPCLEWVDATGQICRCDLVDKIFIGRSCRGVEESRRIVLKDLAVSRDHAIISLDGSHFQITDMSKNGVWVNDVRVEPGSSRDLTNGDIIKVGDTHIAVKLNCDADFCDSIEHTIAEPVEMIVTSLIADVRGFSGISQREGSREVYAFMKRVFKALTDIVHEFKGTVKDYVGDAVYAFWDHGATPHMERAVLACNSARRQLEVVDEMKRQSGFYGSFTAPEFLMGWGITTGKVTMAHYSPRAADLALFGDATNLAFRLSGMANKSLASPIVICSRTAELVGPVLSPINLGPAPVRGRSGEEYLYGFDIKTEP